MTTASWVEGLKAFLADYEARGVQIAELQLDNNAWRLANAELRARIAELEANQPTEPQPEPTPAPISRLKYAPPPLDNPQTITITKPGTVQLDKNRDYLVQCPSTINGALAIVGGRNVVAIGGHVRIPWQGENPTINERRGLLIRDTQGTFHAEGWWFDGDDISEGIQIDAPEAVVQLQNIRIDHVHARDQATFKDNHPDLVQTWGNVRELRIDRFTGSTDYQGFLFKADYNNAGGHGAVFLNRVNIAADPTGRYLFWVHPDVRSAPVTLADVWLDVHPNRSGGLGKSVWPDVDSGKLLLMNADATTPPSARWGEQARPQIVGYVTEGAPPDGDFVPAESVGAGYVSPGYA